MGADFKVIFYLHHKNMLYGINAIDRRKGSFVWLYSRAQVQRGRQPGEDKLAVCHTAVGTEWAGVLLVSTVMEKNVDNVLHISSSRYFFRSSIQCASVCCAVPNVVLHKIMIMPECVEDGSTCQYIWHFEESGFDAIRSKMFETHNNISQG